MQTMQLFSLLWALFHLSAAARPAAVKQEPRFVAAAVGDGVTLRCFCSSKVATHFSWYRQSLGGSPEILINIYKHGDPSKLRDWMEKNPRFSVQRRDDENHLHIADVRSSDTATYLCGSSYSNLLEFGEGTFLSVTGENLTEVVQEPASRTFHPGESVTLNCTVRSGTCDGEHVVYWLRGGKHQGVLHTQLKQTSSPRCVYHLQRTNLSSSDAGTYRCAVAACGHFLFGDGSTLVVAGGGGAEEHAEQTRILVWLSIVRTGTLSLCVALVLLAVYVRKNKQSVKNAL